MSKLKTKIPTDTWVKATWDSYIQALEDAPSFPGDPWERGGLNPQCLPSKCDDDVSRVVPL